MGEMGWKIFKNLVRVSMSAQYQLFIFLISKWVQDRLLGILRFTYRPYCMYGLARPQMKFLPGLYNNSKVGYRGPSQHPHFNIRLVTYYQAARVYKSSRVSTSRSPASSLRMDTPYSLYLSDDHLIYTASVNMTLPFANIYKTTLIYISTYILFESIQPQRQ